MWSIAAACIVLGVFSVGLLPAGAQEVALEGLEQVGDASGLGNEDLLVIIGRIVRVILGFLGVIAVVLVIYAGFLWMTAAGDPAKVEKAKSILVNAGIGLVIILSSLAITQFVMNALTGATGFGDGTRGDGAVELIDPFSTALGAGIIDSHYPGRNAQNIARNTSIVVTFREAIDPASFMDGYAGDTTAVLPLRNGSLRIYPTSGGTGEALAPEQVNVSVTSDAKSVVFDPVPYLGSAAQDTAYTVEIDDEIELADGSPAFEGAFADGYTWRFTVSTELDVTPPRVTSVIPIASTTVARNILLQVNYSEPVSPISADGQTPGFTNIVAAGGAGTIDGTWNLVNAFETSEFVSDTPCGTNSCGEVIYCLPGNDAVTVTVQAASLGAEPPTALLPPNGVVDMAGNSLDGNGDGQAVGPAADNYVWSFSTSDQIVLAPPQILETTPALTPGTPAENVDFDQPVRILFDSLLSLSTVNADNLQLGSPSGALWFSFASAVETLTGSSEPAHRVTVNHGVFSDEQLYGATVGSGLRSVYQNCFTPSRSQTCTGDGANCCNEQSQAGQCSYPHFTL